MQKLLYPGSDLIKQNQNFLDLPKLTSVKCCGGSILLADCSHVYGVKIMRPTHGLGKQMAGPSAHCWPGVGRMPGCLAALRDLKVSNQTRGALGIEPLRPTHPDARMYDSETMR